jgi:hypothetical protein
MRFHFAVYPEAIAKLKDQGLVTRLHKVKEDEDFTNFYGVTYEGDIPPLIDDMKERKFFKEVPKKDLKDVKEKLNAFFQDPGKFKWTIKKPSGEVTEEADLEDFLMLSGYYASFVLNPKEFWNPKKFGFDSCFDLWGSLGAYMKTREGRFFHEGYTWTSELPDGSKFTSEVTGSEHGDFRFFRTDITPYETIDPFGNKVSYRPEFRTDRASVIGYHSVEPMLLASIIKYITQENIPSEILKDKGKKFLEEEIGNLGQRFGPFADAGYSGMRVEEYFWRAEVPIPRLDENDCNTSGKPTFDAVFLDSQSRYGIYVGADKSLVFVYENSESADKR